MHHVGRRSAARSSKLAERLDHFSLRDGHEGTATSDHIYPTTWANIERLTRKKRQQTNPKRLMPEPNMGVTRHVTDRSTPGSYHDGIIGTAAHVSQPCWNESKTINFVYGILARPIKAFPSQGETRAWVVPESISEMLQKNRPRYLFWFRPSVRPPLWSEGCKQDGGMRPRPDSIARMDIRTPQLKWEISGPGRQGVGQKRDNDMYIMVPSCSFRWCGRWRDWYIKKLVHTLIVVDKNKHAYSCLSCSTWKVTIDRPLIVVEVLMTGTSAEARQSAEAEYNC